MRINNFFYKKISLPIAILFTLLMIAYASLVMGSQSECITSQLSEDQSILGLKFGYDMDFVLSVLTQLDSGGLKCYLRLLIIWDNLFPLLYGSMYVSWLSVISKNIFEHKRPIINLYPLIPMIFDWLENYFESGLIREFLNSGSVSEAKVHFSSIITQVKWSASSVNYILILTGVLILLINRYRRRKNQK